MRAERLDGARSCGFGGRLGGGALRRLVAAGKPAETGGPAESIRVFLMGKMVGLAVRSAASASVSANNREESGRRISTVGGDACRSSEADGGYRP